MKLDRFPFTYNGNKYLEARKHLMPIITANSTVDIVAEPFCGIAGFSRAFFEATPTFAGEIWLNDINPQLIDNIRQLKDNPEATLTTLEHQLQQYTTDAELTDAMKASPHCLLSLVCRGMTHRLFKISKGQSKIKNYREKIADYTAFFARVTLYNVDAVEFLALLPSSRRVLVFFDPPYFNSNNLEYKSNNKEGVYNDGTQLYVDIHNAFTNPHTEIRANHRLVLLVNRLAFLNHFFKPWFSMEYTGTYQNTRTKGALKSPKHHMVYKR